MIRVKLSADKKQYTKLSVFDFDGTLFKSPDKPNGFKGNWHISKESLQEPYVPEKPDGTFWNEAAVESAKNELNNPETLTIMMTGRVENVFKDRIEQLLSQQSIHFPITKFGKFGNDTSKFKLSFINRLLKKHPTINKVEMWDDDKEKIQLYKESLQDKIEIKINKI